MGVTAPAGVEVMRSTRTAVADFCACVGSSCEQVPVSVSFKS
jgi:hypothetical protein